MALRPRAFRACVFLPRTSVPPALEKGCLLCPPVSPPPPLLSSRPTHKKSRPSVPRLFSFHLNTSSLHLRLSIFLPEHEVPTHLSRIPPPVPISHLRTYRGSILSPRALTRHLQLSRSLSLSLHHMYLTEQCPSSLHTCLPCTHSRGPTELLS